MTRSNKSSPQGTDRIHEVVRCLSGEDKVAAKLPDEVYTYYIIRK